MIAYPICVLGPGDQHLCSVLGQAGSRAARSPCALGSGDHQKSSALGQADTRTAGLSCILGPEGQQLSLLLGREGTWTEDPPCDQEHNAVLVQAGSCTVSSPHGLRRGSFLPSKAQSIQILGLHLVSGNESSKLSHNYIHISTGNTAKWESS